jgi:hypothetical protein
MQHDLNVDNDEAVPAAHLIERMRLVRNGLLCESDWTQVADAAADAAAWATYRQQLRDFPASWTPAETVDFPDPPA